MFPSDDSNFVRCNIPSDDHKQNKAGLLSVTLKNIFLNLLFKRILTCALTPFGCKESCWKRDLHIYEQHRCSFITAWRVVLVIPPSISLQLVDIRPPPVPPRPPPVPHHLVFNGCL